MNGYRQLFAGAALILPLILPIQPVQAEEQPLEQAETPRPRRVDANDSIHIGVTPLTAMGAAVGLKMSFGRYRYRNGQIGVIDFEWMYIPSRFRGLFQMYGSFSYLGFGPRWNFGRRLRHEVGLYFRPLGAAIYSFDEDLGIGLLPMQVYYRYDFAGYRGSFAEVGVTLSPVWGSSGLFDDTLDWWKGRIPLALYATFGY